MKPLRFAHAVLFLSVLTSTQAQTVGIWYQPTPTPTDKIPHSVCGWLGSNYNTTFKPSITGPYLQVGGWGDSYKLYCRYDMEGMPQNVLNSSFWLMPYPRGDGSATTAVTWYTPDTMWYDSMTWTSQPPLSPRGKMYAPAPGELWGGKITQIYNGWVSSLAQAFDNIKWSSKTLKPNPDWRQTISANTGIFLAPQFTNNNFDVFRSESYADFATDPLADGKRPGWYIEFSRPPNEPDFKMPLPGGGTCDPRNNHLCEPGTATRLYQIKSEIGGTACDGNGDTGHQDVYSVNDSQKPQFNYFALDIVGPFFSGFASTPGGRVPILASASGVVDVVGTDADIQFKFNGNYMVIRHWSGSIDTGYSTLYLHMDSTKGTGANFWPNKADGTPWKRGDQIHQGDRIGFMGNSGQSFGPHLHFAIRYGDPSPPDPGSTIAGAKNILQLTNATMEGFLFKSYQTDCGNGNVNYRYFQSSNRQYQ